MLNEALEIVRGLVDEAIEAEEAAAATKLSRLASQLEKAASFQHGIADMYTPRETIHQETAIIVGEYCDCAEALLTEDQFEVFNAAMSAALATTVPDDAHVAAQKKEFAQVAALFRSGVESKSVGDIVRLGSLLVVKAKQLVKAEIRAGVLLDSESVRAMAQPIIDANAAARRALGREACDRVVDAMLLRFPGGQSDES